MNYSKNTQQLMNQQTMSKTTMWALLFASLLTFSCNENKKSDTMGATGATTEETTDTKYAAVSNEVIEDYLALKDALVDTNQETAMAASEKLVAALKDYDLNSQSSKLSASIVSATEHAENMSGSDIEKQREQFELLSKDMIDIVVMMGTDVKLYQQYCPMFGEDGGAWLSKEEKIRNPYFGSKMMNCGEVQKEIN